MQRLRPFEAELDRLETIPGVKRRTAEVLAAEIGLDMSHFPTAGHLASWAGMCPGNHESAGKRKTGKTRKGSKWLRRALTESGRAAARKKGSYPSVQYRRLIVRGGPKKAAVAVGHTLLITISSLLTRQDVYHDVSTRRTTARSRQEARHATTRSPGVRRHALSETTRGMTRHFHVRAQSTQRYC